MTDKVQEIMALVSSYLHTGLLSDRDAIESRLREVVAPPVPEPTERLQGEIDAITELNHAQWLALENVRTLAARNRKEDWAQHLLRWCAGAGNAARILRAPTEATHTQPASEPVPEVLWPNKYREQPQRFGPYDEDDDISNLMGDGS